VAGGLNFVLSFLDLLSVPSPPRADAARETIKHYHWFPAASGYSGGLGQKGDLGFKTKLAHSPRSLAADKIEGAGKPTQILYTEQTIIHCPIYATTFAENMFVYSGEISAFYKRLLCHVSYSNSPIADLFKGNGTESKQRPGLASATSNRNSPKSAGSEHAQPCNRLMSEDGA